MGRKPGQSKQLMLTSAITLLRERGTAGVSIDAVLAHSGAPRGSVYHHFPGGRNELLLDAVKTSGDYISALIDEAVAEGNPRAALTRFAAFWRDSLVQTDYRAGCPIAALTVDSRDDLPAAGEVVREVFTRWQEKLSALLEANDLPAPRARRLSTMVVAAVEGAVILCQAERSADPLDEVIAEILPLLP